MQLVIEIYKLTAKFPREELYGLVSQMRRAAISIPSNIAEGSRCSTRKDFRNFLINAFGSGGGVGNTNKNFEEALAHQ